MPANVGDAGLIPGSGRSPGEENGNPLQYFCLKNPMDRGAWQGMVHKIAKSRTRLKQLSTRADALWSPYYRLPWTRGELGNAVAMSRLDSESNTRVPATLKPGRTEFTTNTCDSSPPRDSRGNWVAAVCRRQSCKRQFCVMMKNTVWSGVTLSWIWILAPQLHTYMIRQSSLIFLGSKMEMARGSQIVGRIKWDNVCTEQKHDQ